MNDTTGVSGILNRLGSAEAPLAQPIDLTNGKWVPVFLRAVGEEQIRREGYLCHRAANGEVACKACGRYLPESTPMQAHFVYHLAELDKYLADRREQGRDEAAEGFYPKPCTSCGNRIPRTGKPGRPPTKCSKCEFPLSALQSQPEAEGDQQALSEADKAILAEFGL